MSVSDWFCGSILFTRGRQRSTPILAWIATGLIAALMTSGCVSPTGSGSGRWSGTLEWEDRQGHTLTAEFVVEGRPRFKAEAWGVSIDSEEQIVRAMTKVTNTTPGEEWSGPGRYVRLGVVLPVESSACWMPPEVRSGVQETSTHCFFPIMEISTNGPGIYTPGLVIEEAEAFWVVPWLSTFALSSGGIPDGGIGELVDTLNNPERVAVVDCSGISDWRNQGFSFGTGDCTMLPVNETPFAAGDVGAD